MTSFSSQSKDSTSQPQTLPIDLEMSQQTLEEGQKTTTLENNFNHLVNNDSAGNETNTPKM